MNKEIDILELFSGTGGFTKGFIDAGYTINNHYFSEVDAHAIANYTYNFPHAKYIGSVKYVRGCDLPNKPHVITFGSPCQDFSLAGKRTGMAGQRSCLITEAIRVVSELRPHVFIWENVKGAFSSNDSKDFWAIIKAFADIGGYRLEWQLLNTSWFLPQNRERIYLIGHLAGHSECGVFPIRESIELRSKSNEGKEKIHENSLTLTAKGNSNNTGSFVATNFQGNNIANTLRTTGSQTMSNKHNFDCVRIASATKQGYEEAHIGDSINLSVPNSKTRRGRVGKGVSQTLDTQCNQAVIVNEVIQVNPSTESGDKQPFQQNRVYSDQGIAPALDTESGRKSVYLTEPTHLHKDQRIYHEIAPTIQSAYGTGGDNIPYVNQQDQNIRRLTEIECERLQGYPDDWTKFGTYSKKVWINKKEKTFKIVIGNYPIPKTQRYKLLGNAVSVCMPKIIAERLTMICQNKIKS